MNLDLQSAVTMILNQLVLVIVRTKLVLVNYGDTSLWLVLV